MSWSARRRSARPPRRRRRPAEAARQQQVAAAAGRQATTPRPTARPMSRRTRPCRHAAGLADGRRRRQLRSPAPPLQAAMSQLGVPYVYGGASPDEGFDCSGLVQWA